ncbi:MAG: ATPase, T2SS/T4P/T4SS family, partial [Patescibacteria group bacterium]
MSILDTLAKKGIIETGDIATIKAKAQSMGATLEEALLTMGVSSEDILASKGEYFEVPIKKVVESEISEKILGYIPEESASYYQFVPIGFKNGVLEIGILDPDNLAARDAINFIASKINLPYKVYLISQSDFDAVIKMYKGLSGEVTKALSELETEFIVDANRDPDARERKSEETTNETNETNEDLSSVTENAKVAENAPVTKIVATILRYATDGGASDIHIEPQESSVRVRFRVDGMMNTSLVLPGRVHSAVVARIKIMSNMRLDEKRKPQDGRFSAKLNNRKIDFRVSTFPTYFGEKVVIRILDQITG